MALRLRETEPQLSHQLQTLPFYCFPLLLFLLLFQSHFPKCYLPASPCSCLCFLRVTQAQTGLNYIQNPYKPARKNAQPNRRRMRLDRHITRKKIQMVHEHLKKKMFKVINKRDANTSVPYTSTCLYKGFLHILSIAG